MAEDSVTFSEGFIREQSEIPPYDPHPRMIPFAAGSPEQYEVLSLPAASLALFLEEQSGEIGFIAVGNPLGGLFIGMTPNQLRGFSAATAALADQLDGGRGKQ
jgi:hypothetical protein